uniref:Protein phosphatase n=1 Tax=Eutreptiella gymnastica TaxID=73025 RepID=A0A7S1JAT9_9EUGL|mmetsp:Transcript_80837/g.142457  ORF Transcript_80837/g.142457 Transcript_80837/m.142457 type:complete len:332 (+) Transcript_80837:64-1059(+)
MLSRIPPTAVAATWGIARLTPKVRQIRLLSSPWCRISAVGISKDNVVEGSSELSVDPTLCGEDSFFIRTIQDGPYMTSIAWFGVADGVGGWRQYGVDPGLIARQVMRNASALVHGKGFPNNHTSAQMLIGESYWKVVYGKEVEAGSTTVCMAKVWPGVSKGFEILPKAAWMSDTKPAEVDEYILEVANIGDSGLIVLRPSVDKEGDAQTREDGQKSKPVRCVWQTPFNRIGQNAPLQLAVVPESMHQDGMIMTDPCEASVYRWRLQQGDILVMGTDGVWDNISPSNVEDITVECMGEGGLDVDMMARRVVEESLEGPKLDDITVSVCHITG